MTSSMKPPAELNDEELTERLAMDVMGWKLQDTGDGRMGWFVRKEEGTSSDGRHYTTHVYRDYADGWRPLTDWNHTMEVLQALKAKKIKWQLYCINGSNDHILCSLDIGSRYGGCVVEDPNGRRAICLSALLSNRQNS